jgi:hypothetical protein
MGSSAVRVLALSAGTLAGLVAPTAAFAAPSDPPGNNGTIKVDAAPFDDAPNNEPHVDCVFQIDFYGFDEGDFYADVVFEGHAPTGGGTLLTDRVFIGEDANDGGGSTAGLDASATYDLTAALAGIEPHAQQGWHVKLTIHADGSHGADTKHKVFWVDGCRPAPAPAPAAVAPAVEEPTTTTTAPPATTTTVAPTTTETVASSTTVVEEEAPEGVLGVSAERAAPAREEPVVRPAAAERAQPTDVGSGSLPRTGAAIGLLTALGAGLVIAGRAVRRAAAGR